MAWWWHGPSAAVHPQGFVDDRHGDVMVVRPMREYMAKEIAFYNHFFDVPTVVAPPLPTKVRTSPVPWWGGSQALHPHGGNGTLPPPILPLPSPLAPPAPGEAQHPPPDGTLPPGAAGRFPLHHQHCLPVWCPLHGDTPG